MGFFHVGNKSELALVQGSNLSVSLLHNNQCAVCPLNHAPDLRHPKMEPYGVHRPKVYILGEAPGEVEDRRGIPFVGESGELLKRYLPESIIPQLRWNNVIRCRPPDNRDPREVEIECCRPSVEQDIEATKPVAIFGFGNVPLWWALKQSGITKWCGRRVPIRVGKHACWYYPMMHPSYILHNRKFTPYKEGQYGCEEEFAFAHQLKMALCEVERGLPPPIVHTEEEALCGLELVTGEYGEDDLDRVRCFFNEIRDEPIVGHDYETNAFRPYNKGTKILSVAFSGAERALGIALDHRGNKWKPAHRRKAYDLVSQFIHSGRSRRRRLVSHHLPFELEWSASFFGDDCLWGTDWGDTESQAYILDERPYAFALDFLCVQHFGISIKAIDNLDRDHLDDCPIESVLRYNALDSKYHRLLYLVQEERLERTNMLRVYDHQIDRTIAMIPMQLDGLPIDHDLNRQMRNTYTSKLKQLEEDIAQDRQALRYRDRIGKAYRPSSLDDVKRYLTEILRKRNWEKVDEKTLKEIDDPLIKKTRRWRKLNKVLSTYILPVGEGSKHLYSDGKLHPITSTTRTRTWRTSGQEPNTQNWPVRNLIAMKARRQIAASTEDECFVAFDYAGIQARNVAMESKDKALIKSFKNHYDIHTDWMERIIKHYPEWVPGGTKALRDKAVAKNLRYRAKNQLVFPSFFGAQPKSIGKNLQIPEDIATDLHEEFWDKFPDIKDWHEATYDAYQKTGYVTGLSGFRRHAPVKRNEMINCPIQSDESLIVTNAMARLSRLGYNPCMEIHDDLTFLWPKKKVDEYAEVVIAEMLKIKFDWINVPLELEMKIGGRNWGSMEEVGKFESVGKDSWKELK